MSRDMKPRKRSAPVRRKSGGGMLVGLFLGLVIGVLIAAGVVWYIFSTPPPFSNQGQPSPSANANAPAANGTTAPGPLALPGKPGDKPRFEFYDILPGKTDAVTNAPDPQQADTKPTEQKPAETVQEVVTPDAGKENQLKDPLFLQTGSFQNPGDADNQKAKLAMQGIEASVQQVMVQDKVWYRVRLGPFTNMGEINGMRSQLAGQGIEANVVKKD